MAKKNGSVQYAYKVYVCVGDCVIGCVQMCRVCVCVCVHVSDQRQTLKTVLISHFMENVKVISSGFPL